MNHRKILLSTLLAVSLGAVYASCQAQGNSTDGELGDGESQHSSQSHNTQHNGMEEELTTARRMKLQHPDLREAESEEINEQEDVEVSNYAGNSSQESEDDEDTKKKKKFFHMMGKVIKKYGGNNKKLNDSKKEYWKEKRKGKAELQQQRERLPSLQTALRPPTLQQLQHQGLGTPPTTLLQRARGLGNSQTGDSSSIRPFTFGLDEEVGSDSEQQVVQMQQQQQQPGHTGLSTMLQRTGLGPQTGDRHSIRPFRFTLNEELSSDSEQQQSMPQQQQQQQNNSALRFLQQQQQKPNFGSGFFFGGPKK